MYSYEERILAVQLYIELGKRTAASICPLLRPSPGDFSSMTSVQEPGNIARSALALDRMRKRVHQRTTRKRR